MKPALPVLVAAALLAAAPLAKAAPTATPLQLQMAQKMLEFNDFRSQAQTGMEDSTLSPALLDARPDWRPLFKAAIAEELDHDMPAIDSMVGQALGRTFTDDELKVGLTIVSDKNLRAIYLAAQNHAPQPDVQIAKATEDALATPAGQSFANKLQTIDDVLQPLLVQVTGIVVPGALRRFGEKAEAAEERRPAATGSAGK